MHYIGLLAPAACAVLVWLVVQSDSFMMEHLATSSSTSAVEIREKYVDSFLHLLQLSSVIVLSISHWFMELTLGSMEAAITSFLIICVSLYGGEMRFGLLSPTEEPFMVQEVLKKRRRDNSPTTSTKRRSVRRRGLRRVVKNFFRNSFLALRPRKLFSRNRGVKPLDSLRLAPPLRTQTSASSPEIVADPSVELNSERRCSEPTMFSSSSFARISSVFDNLYSLSTVPSALFSPSSSPYLSSPSSPKVPQPALTSNLSRSFSEPALPLASPTISQSPAIPETPTLHAPKWANQLSDKELEFMEAELSEAPAPEKQPTGEWEVLLMKEFPMLSYTVWKKPWKNGLNAFKSSTIIQGITPKELYSFQSDCPHRAVWDSNVEEFRLLERSPESSHTQLEYWCSKFPCPLANREYVMVKQDWQDESGSLFSLSKGVDSDVYSLRSQGRRKRVAEYLVGTKVEEVIPPGQDIPATQLVQYCYEDNGVSASLINASLKRGLLGFVQTRQTALQRYVTSDITSLHGTVLPPKLGTESSPESFASVLTHSNMSSMQVPDLVAVMQRSSRELVRTQQEMQARMGCVEKRPNFVPASSWLSSLMPTPWLQRWMKEGEMRRRSKRALLASEMEKAVKEITQRQAKLQNAWKRFRMPLPLRPRRLLQALSRRRRAGLKDARERGAQLVDQVQRRRSGMKRRIGMMLVAIPLVSLKQGVKSAPKTT